MQSYDSAQAAIWVKFATDEVFSTMLGLPIEAGEPRFEQRTPVPSGGVLAFIGLAGRWAGTGCVSCSAALACQISSQLLMGEYTAVDDDVLDAMAEVTNMIHGNVKTSLEEVMGPMGLSIPTVVYGRNFTSKTAGNHAWLVVPFLCGGEQMEVRLCLVQNTENDTAQRATFAGTQMVGV